MKALLQNFFDIQTSTAEERAIVLRVCQLVGVRAARLAACGIAALCMKMNRLDGCTIAIDGSLFEVPFG